MNKFILCTALAALTAATASVQAKDKHKDKDKHRDGDRRESYESRGRDDHRDHRDHHDGNRERSRTIYVIERDRPVQRVVYIDSDGRYYQRRDGRRVYVRERYFESYPSKYYTSEGRRRINITLPF